MKYLVRIPVTVTVWAQVEAESKDEVIKLARVVSKSISIDVDPDNMIESLHGAVVKHTRGEIEITDDHGVLNWIGLESEEKK